MPPYIISYNKGDGTGIQNKNSVVIQSYAHTVLTCGKARIKSYQSLYYTIEYSFSILFPTGFLKVYK